jgi:hypothetical protein
MPIMFVKMFMLKLEAYRSIEGETAAVIVSALYVLHPYRNVTPFQVGTQQI